MACHPGDGGRGEGGRGRGEGGALLQGLPGDRGGAGYFGLRWDYVIPSWELGDGGRLHPGVTHLPPGKPPSCWSLSLFWKKAR